MPVSYLLFQITSSELPFKIIMAVLMRIPILVPILKATRAQRSEINYPRSQKLVLPNCEASSPGSRMPFAIPSVDPGSALVSLAGWLEIEDLRPTGLRLGES